MFLTTSEVKTNSELEVCYKNFTYLYNSEKFFNVKCFKFLYQKKKHFLISK